jgi:hypothetical protein
VLVRFTLPSNEQLLCRVKHIWWGSLKDAETPGYHATVQQLNSICVFGLQPSSRHVDSLVVRISHKAFETNSVVNKLDYKE